MRLPIQIALIGLFGCAGGAAAPGPASAPASTPASAPASGPASAPHDHDHGHAHGAEGHDHGRHMAHRFDDPEYWSKRFDDPKRDAWQLPQALVALLDLAPGMTVADIGAGTGYFVLHLSPAVGPEGKVLALDIEPRLVEHMTARAAGLGLTNVEAKVVAPDDPGLAPESVDRIVIIDTWHHIAGRPEYSRKLFAALRPGGALFVVDFTQDSPTGPPVKFRLAPEVVATTLRVAGFEASVLEETLPRQYVVKGRRPLED